MMNHVRRYSTKPGVWSQFANRSEQLSIQNQKLKKAVIDGVDEKYGPASYTTKKNKLRYSSPIGLKEVFPVAYDILEKHAAEQYKKLEEVNAKLENDKNNKELIAEKKKLMIEAEKYNPEVLYKVQFTEFDRQNLNVPIYQEFYKINQWEGYKLMLLMQRIEQLHILPDALPTISPSKELNVKFVNESGVNRILKPGEIISSKVSSKQPVFQIKTFDSEINENDKYTIIIADLDQPDLELNSFKTSLNYALKDVTLSEYNQIIGLREEDGIELSSYIPPVPEKNSPTHRFVTILLKQGETSVSLDGFDTEDFSIREFVAKHDLEPVGINCWRSEWDSNVSQVRQLYGLPEGRVFHRVRR